MMPADAFAAYVLNGLVQASCLFLVASGLTLIFGVLGILNFAHAALFMLAAYLAAQVSAWSGSFWVALLVAPPVLALVGAGLERGLLRRVYDAPVAYQLLLTFGVIMLIKDLIKLLWGTAWKTFSEPPVFSGTLVVLGRPYPLYNVAYIGCVLLIGLALWTFLHRTRTGKVVRAAAADRDMANAVGINVPLVYTGVCALGTALAAIMGVYHGPMMNIHLDVDQDYVVEAFAVVVIGGLGSMRGAFVGALAVGILRSIAISVYPELEMLLIYFIVIVVLVLRPRGLFGGAET